MRFKTIIDYVIFMFLENSGAGGGAGVEAGGEARLTGKEQNFVKIHL